SVGTAFVSSSFIHYASGQRTSSSSESLLHDSGTEPNIVDGGARQLLAELLQEPPLVKTRQFLHEHAIAYNHLEHAATQRSQACVFGPLRPDGFCPGPLEVQPLLPPSPATGREQTTKNLSQTFGPFFSH